MGCDMAEVVVHLPSICKALGLIPSTAKKKKKKKKYDTKFGKKILPQI
jgi:hypothetical protein